MLLFVCEFVGRPLLIPYIDLPFLFLSLSLSLAEAFSLTAIEHFFPCPLDPSKYSFIHESELLIQLH